MLDIGWTELLIIGVVALVVVGPKDLPKMFRTVGQFMGKARAMAREFQRAMDAAADESGVKDMAREMRRTASGEELRKDLGIDELEREMNAMGRPDRWADEAGTPGARPAAPRAEAAAERDADLAAAADHDAAQAARQTARTSAAERTAAARQKAAETRARRKAAAEPAAPRPAKTPKPEA